MRFLTIALAVFTVLTLSTMPVIAKGEGMQIKEGSKVTFDYTLTVDGNVVQTSEGKEPVQYVQGEGMILPGLATGMEGMKAGEEKDITLTPEDAYGEVNEEAFKEVPKEALPKDIDLQPGLMLQVAGPNGQPMPVTVTEVKDNSVIIDFNHPLAGKTLNFDVKVKSVE